MKKYLKVAYLLSDILHSLEKRGVQLNTKENRQWFRATVMIEKLKRGLL